VYGNCLAVMRIVKADKRFEPHMRSPAFLECGLTRKKLQAFLANAELF
jgi:hypothetical protein